MQEFRENSETKKNLIKAFIGESMARNKYNYFAKAAHKEGYIQIGNIFNETAENEKEHAKIFLKYLGEDFQNIEFQNTMFSSGITNSSLKNLEYAIIGEHEENTTLYPNYAKIAEEENYPKIANSFWKISEVEYEHEKRYKALLENIKEGLVFEKNKEVIWKCTKCGYHYKGTKAPAQCPSCKHPQGYFELFVKNY